MYTTLVPFAQVLKYESLFFFLHSKAIEVRRILFCSEGKRIQSLETTKEQHVFSGTASCALWTITFSAVFIFFSEEEFKTVERICGKLPQLDNTKVCFYAIWVTWPFKIQSLFVKWLHFHLSAYFQNKTRSINCVQPIKTASLLCWQTQILHYQYYPLLSVPYFGLKISLISKWKISYESTSDMAYIIFHQL